MHYKAIFILFLFNCFAKADVNDFEVIDTDSFNYTTNDQRITIKVEMEEIDVKTIKEHVEKKNGVNMIVKVTQGDRELPKDMNFYPLKTLIKSFEIHLDGKKIPFPKKYWQDIVGLNIYAIESNISLKKKENRHAYHRKIASLDNPIPTLSTEWSDPQSTIYLKWVRREDGDTSTAFRWIISPDGTVLKHAEFSQFHDADY